MDDKEMKQKLVDALGGRDEIIETLQGVIDQQHATSEVQRDQLNKLSDRLSRAERQILNLSESLMQFSHATRELLKKDGAAFECMDERLNRLAVSVTTLTKEVSERLDTHADVRIRKLEQDVAWLQSEIEMEPMADPMAFDGEGVR